MKPGRVTRSAPAPAPARGGQETEEKLFSKLRREGTPRGRTRWAGGGGRVGRGHGRWAGTRSPGPRSHALPPSSKPLRRGAGATEQGPTESRRDSLQASSLQGFLNSRHTCEQTRGPLSCGFVAGCVLGFLNFRRAGWGGGVDGKGTGSVSHWQTRTHLPPTPSLQVQTIELSCPALRQGLLLNLGAKGSDGAGGREGSPDGSLPLTPGPAVRI